MICTDCHALLTTALAGPSSATHYDRPLARVWSKIVFVVGDDLPAVVNSGKLVWVLPTRTLRRWVMLLRVMDRS